VRNRVAHNDVHRVRSLAAARAAVLALVPTTFALLAATVAAADTPATAERWSEGLAGPVGIVAVALGIGGLLIGLVRRRRTVAARTALAETRPMSAVGPEPVRSDSAA
jgi:hypothetical protein